MANIPFHLPIELGSPVEFILAGSFGTEYGVLVQSFGAKIDLIARARRSDKDELDVSIPFWILKRRRLIRVKSISGKPHVNSGETDSRFSELVFVWRCNYGHSRFDKLIEIELTECLSIHGDDIVEALYEGSQSKIAWAIAEVIDVCIRFEKRMKLRWFKMRVLLSIITLLYVLIGSYWFIRQLIEI